MPPSTSTSAPILALPQKSSTQNQPLLKPNILPAKIHHSGPIPITQRHWSPSSSTTTTSTNEQEEVTFFRGRKLLGHTITLPENYTGILAQKTEKSLPVEANEDEDEDEDISPPAEVKTMETLGTFDSIVVWGHEVLPDGSEDPYMRGLEEWIGVTESIHAHDNKQPES